MSFLQSRLLSLVGDEARGFRNPDGTPMYTVVRAHKGSQLRRVGATENCIICGIPEVPGVVAFAHIHMRDLHLSPMRDPTRVFCLCWLHHHGFYDQGYISTMQLLEAEATWVENRRRPRPHSRDLALIRRIQAGELKRDCAWTKSRVQRIPVFPANATALLRGFEHRLKGSPRPPKANVKGSIAALRAHATRWQKQAEMAATEEDKVLCTERATEFLTRARSMK